LPLVPPRKPKKPRSLSELDQPQLWHILDRIIFLDEDACGLRPDVAGALEFYWRLFVCPHSGVYRKRPNDPDHEDALLRARDYIKGCQRDNGGMGYGQRIIETSDGGEHDWPVELAEKVMSLQREDGSWVNTNQRWFETDPILVTSYMVRTLSICREIVSSETRGQ
jgi:hypothetical protein